MTAHHRPLFLFAVALLLPACLHFKDSAPIDPPSDQAAKPDANPKADPARKTQFAELPSRPGAVVPLNPANEKPVVTQPIDPDTKSAQFSEGSVNPSLKIPTIPPVPEPLLLAAVRAQVEGHPERVIELLSALDRPNQDLVLSLLHVIDRGVNVNMKGNPVETAILADQLRDSASRIESRAALRVDTVALCRNVVGYGRYKLWPRDQSYKPNDVAQLYIEVKNLICQPVVGPEGETYLTHVEEYVEVRDAEGKIVFQVTRDGMKGVVHTEKRLFTHTPVHEFHILYEFFVPSTVGVYTVTMTIKDPVTGRTVKTKPVEFTVAVP